MNSLQRDRRTDGRTDDGRQMKSSLELSAQVSEKAEFFMERDDNSVLLPGKENVH